MSLQNHGRRYTVTSRVGAATPAVSRFAEPESALDHFENMLYASEHSDPAVRQHLRTLTAVLMKGALGFEVLDPDLNGSVSITITTA